METNLLLNEDELNRMSKSKLLKHIMAQVKQINKLRGYRSENNGLSKIKCSVLVKVALTNNEYIKEFSDKNGVQ